LNVTSTGDGQGIHLPIGEFKNVCKSASNIGFQISITVPTSGSSVPTVADLRGGQGAMAPQDARGGI